MSNVVEYILKINADKEAELKKLKSELFSTRRELDKTGRKGKTSFKKLAEGVDRAKASISKMNSMLRGAAVGVTGLGAAVFAASKMQADYVNQLNDTSTRTGIAIKSLAGLKLAVESAGVGFETVGSGLNALSPKMADAANKSSEAGKVFAGLGVSVTDANGDLRDTNEVFNEIIEQLNKVGNAVDKKAYTFKIFGESAGAAILQSGFIEGMDAAIKKAEELGPALDENGIRKAADFEAGFAQLKTSLISAMGSIAELFTGEKGLGDSMKNLAEDLGLYAHMVKIFFQDLKDVLMPVVNLFMNIINLEKELTGGAIASYLSKIGPQAYLLGLAEYAQEVKGRAKEQISMKDMLTEEQKALLDDVEIRSGAETFKSGLDAPASYSSIVMGDQPEETEEQKAKRLASEKRRQEAARQLLDIEKQRRALAMELMSDREQEDFILKEQIDDTQKIIDTNKQGSKNRIEAEQLMIDLLNKQKRLTVERAAEDKKAADKLETSAKKQVENAGKLIGKYDDLQKKIKAGSISLEEAESISKDLLQSIENVDLSVLEEVDFSEFQKIESFLLGIADNLKISIIDLKKLIQTARDEAKKIAKIEMGMSMAVDVVSMARGDILGGASGLLQTAMPAQAGMISGGAATIQAVADLGQQIIDAQEKGIDDYVAKLASQQERALGRKLTDEELQAIRDGISEDKKESIGKQAMREDIQARSEAFMAAFVVGMEMLPDILTNVLPPILFDAFLELNKLMLTLPIRFAKAVIDGILGLAEKIKDFFVDAFSFFGGDDKRKGGRYISARSGIRYTGMSDGLAMLHRNEFVVSESGARPQGVKRIMQEQNNKNININIYSSVVEQNAVDELIRKIERRFQTFGSSQSTLFAG